MPNATRDILTPISFSSEQSTVLYPYMREVFIDEAPIFTLFPPAEQADGETYNIVTFDVRQRAFVVGTGGITNVATSLPLADASSFQVGDVLEIVTSSVAERVEVTADPVLTTTPNTITVRRAREGTSGAAHSAGDAITLIGNSRTGGEVNQTANRMVRTLVPQYVQTFQFPVQVGGKANALNNVRLPNGIKDPFTMEQKVKLTEFVRDVEYSSYYGIGEAPAAAGDRAKQKGLKTLIASGNVKTNGGASYTKLNLVADAYQKAIDGGGNPDVLLVSTNFTTGLATWSVALQSFRDRQYTELGVAIDYFAVPFLPKPVRLIPSFQLKAGTAVALTSSDVKMRKIRDAQWTPRGNRGDAMEGDFIGDYCIEIGHPSWHAWVEGITSFA